MRTVCTDTNGVPRTACTLNECNAEMSVPSGNFRPIAIFYRFSRRFANPKTGTRLEVKLLCKGDGSYLDRFQYLSACCSNEGAHY